MSDRQKGRRINGLQRPFHYLQIVTWVLYPCILIHFFSFLMQLLWERPIIKYIVIVTFVVLAISTIVGAYMTLSIDPADDLVIAKTSPTHNAPPLPSATGDNIYCYICETSVHSSR